MVVPITELSGILVQVGNTYFVVLADYPPFQQGPEGFYSVRVNIPVGVGDTEVDRLVVHEGKKGEVTAIFVGYHRC